MHLLPFQIPPSPCSTLERLLAESRIMVEKLEINSTESSVHNTTVSNKMVSYCFADFVVRCTQ